MSTMPLPAIRDEYMDWEVTDMYCVALEDAGEGCWFKCRLTTFASEAILTLESQCPAARQKWVCSLVWSEIADEQSVAIDRQSLCVMLKMGLEAWASGHHRRGAAAEPKEMAVDLEWDGFAKAVRLLVDVRISETRLATVYVLTLHSVDLTEDDRLRGQTLQAMDELAAMKERVAALERQLLGR